jgi:alanine racemase
MSLRSTRLEVDLDALGRNTRHLRAFLDATAPTAGSLPAAQLPRRDAAALCAVVKADAYGLGAVRVAKEFAAAGADMLAVACLQEATEMVRGFGGAPPLPVLVMGHTPDEGIAEAVSKGIRLTIFDLRQAALVSAAARVSGVVAKVHIKIDSGMNRLGIKPDAETPALLESMAALPGLALEGIFTHLALCEADSDHRQFGLFMEVVEAAEARGLRFAYRHACDSIGLARYPEYRLDLVRAGAVLYGARPGNAPLASGLELAIPFAFRTRVSRLRHIGEGEGVGYDFTWRAGPGGADIATLPVGYVDGYRRCLSNKAEVILKGRRAPVVGLICMDQLVIDATGIPGAAEGDEVLLFGRSGQDELGLMEVATWAGTNRNEVLASIGRRVPRVYHRSGRIESVVDYLGQEEGP